MVPIDRWKTLLDDAVVLAKGGGQGEALSRLSQLVSEALQAGERKWTVILARNAGVIAAAAGKNLAAVQILRHCGSGGSNGSADLPRIG
jgi:hypothetical protein